MTSEYLQAGFSRHDVEVLDRQTLYSGFFSLEQVSLRHRRYEGGWTPRLDRELFVRPPAVGVLLYDPRLREVVLIEQCRVGALDIAGQDWPGTPDSPWLLELVAGLVEPGETPEEVAHREALEEAGCRIDSLIALPGYLSSPGGSDEWITLFCGLLDASQAGGIHGLEEENEDIRVQRLPVSGLQDAMARGRLCNAMALIAVQWLLLNEPELQCPQGDDGQGMTTTQDESQ